MCLRDRRVQESALPDGWQNGGGGPLWNYGVFSRRIEREKEKVLASASPSPGKP